jgi:hypothetical protein
VLKKNIAEDYLNKDPPGTIEAKGSFNCCPESNMILKGMPKAGHLAKASNLMDPQNIPYRWYVNIQKYL